MIPRFLAGLMFFALALGAEELRLPKIDAHWPAADLSALLQKRLTPASFHFDKEKRDWFQMDFRSCDLSYYDLSHNADMSYASFDSKTVFPRLPAGYDPSRIMELGKNPGLGVRALHRRGITGKGVGIAIIDQTLLVDHVEYGDRLMLYEEIESHGTEAVMHAPAVSSIALGKTVGVAPGAALYFIAAGTGHQEGGEWVWDLSATARAIERIVEINRQLPADRKVRVISISLGVFWMSKAAGYVAVKSAIGKAENDGIFVLSAGDPRYAVGEIGRMPAADPDTRASYEAAVMGSANVLNGRALGVPTDSRTMASPTGAKDYFFGRTGGASWTVPWMAGLYALACQIRPSLTPQVFWKAALETAGPVQYRRDGGSFTLQKVVYPVALLGRLTGL